MGESPEASQIQIQPTSAGPKLRLNAALRLRCEIHEVLLRTGTFVAEWSMAPGRVINFGLVDVGLLRSQTGMLRPIKSRSPICDVQYNLRTSILSAWLPSSRIRRLPLLVWTTNFPNQGARSDRHETSQFGGLPQGGDLMGFSHRVSEICTFPAYP
jgi:hypothetical protein